MKRIDITYNPYKLRTNITIDGNLPKQNSSLNVGNRRLQEWIERIPKILFDECRDANFDIVFTGTKADYDDLCTVFASDKDVNANITHIQKSDVADVEDEIDRIFKEIEEGNVPELRSDGIINAFKRAKNQEFEVNVVATMSAGKSTLINALLSKPLMPAAQQATTATIVKIIDTDQPEFTAVAYDKSGQIVKTLPKVSQQDMKDLNDDESVSVVELRGKIPFVKSTGMKLVLIDTPGPNNSRDERHKEMTDKMLVNSENSLVLFVLNATQAGINDEKLFLQFVCDCMNAHGKQSHDRFIFAVNKMDDFKISQEGNDYVERQLKNTDERLCDHKIYQANLFPVSALSALELRTKDEDADRLNSFKNKLDKLQEKMFLENYYQYNHLPLTVKARIDLIKEKANEDTLVEIHTGVVSIEHAISQYVNKYARTAKVAALVTSFNNKLEELAAIANLEKNIREDKDARLQLEADIKALKDSIGKAEEAKSLNNEIDKIDVTKDVKKEIEKSFNYIKDTFNQIISGMDDDVSLAEADTQCKELEKDIKESTRRLKIKVEKIVQDSYNTTLNSVIAGYKKHLADISLKTDTKALTVNNIEKLIAVELNDIEEAKSRHSSKVDKGHYETETYTVRNEGSFLRKTAHYLSFGIINDYTIEEKTREKWISNMQTTVNMQGLANDYLTPILGKLNDSMNEVLVSVDEETNKLKNNLKSELKKINDFVVKKLEDIASKDADVESKDLEIRQKEENLNWMMGIQNRVNELIDF